jgi:hypothetical protein
VKGSFDDMRVVKYFGFGYQLPPRDLKPTFSTRTGKQLKKQIVSKTWKKALPLPIPPHPLSFIHFTILNLV